MRIIGAAALAAMLATQAHAGALVFDLPVESEVIVAPAAAATAFNPLWLLPLVALAAVAIAANSGGDDNDSPVLVPE